MHFSGASNDCAFFTSMLFFGTLKDHFIFGNQLSIIWCCCWRNDISWFSNKKHFSIKIVYHRYLLNTKWKYLYFVLSQQHHLTLLRPSIFCTIPYMKRGCLLNYEEKIYGIFVSHGWFFTRFFIKTN